MRELSDQQVPQDPKVTVERRVQPARLVPRATREIPACRVTRALLARQDPKAAQDQPAPRVLREKLVIKDLLDPQAPRVTPEL